MSLSPLFPHYGPLGSGPYYVSLAIPGAPSEISKSLGLSTPTGVLLPNVDFLTKFSEGELGISDSFTKDMIFKNMNSPIASSNEAIFKQFAKQNKIDVSDISKFKKGNKFVMPKDQIKIPSENDLTGFKSFEKTTLQSIFETQKPYMEIVKASTETIAKAEDIIARVMPFFGDPLTVKSKVPTKNTGGNGGPKAIGYKNAEELKKELNGVAALIKKGMNVSTNNTGSTSSNPNNVGFTQSNTNSNTGGFTSTHWQVISTVYSTGIYNPKLEYDYKYINLPADEPAPSVPLDDIDLSNGDPFEKFKPKSLIFGIYNSKGEAIDPSELLKTIGMNGNNKTEVETPFKRADWLLRSPKWKITDGYEWPSFAEPNYVWQNSIGNTIVSDKKPASSFFGGEYSIKKYDSGQTDVLTGQPAIKDNPVIQSFKKIEETAHRNEFSDIIDIGLSTDNTITSEFKKQVNTDVLSKIDLNSQLQVSYLYGHSKISVYKPINNGPAFPDMMRKSYKPYEIYSPEAAKDPVLSAAAIAKGKKPGMIWVEPDADYDMKIIRIDPISTIEYTEAQGGPETETTIQKFVKNRVRFEMSNGATFSFSLSKNGKAPDILEDVQEFTFENWNFENPKLVNTNEFTVSMWTKEPPNRFTNGSNFFTFRVDRPKFTINDFLAKIGVTQSTPTLVDQFNQIPTYDYYSITKTGGDWYFSSNTGTILKNGINQLGDGTTIYTENSIVKRWYQLYETKLTGPGVGFNLPAFGITRTMKYNYDTDKFDVTDKNIPLYRLKIDQKYSSSKIIDPSQVTNNKLTKEDIFIKDLWYGHGSFTDPQTLGIIKRYALTDLDTESYYIVEGVLRKENPFQEDELGNRVRGGKGGGKSWYRIGDAIGACRVFVNLLSSIFTKLIPKIVKLLSLFQNPFNFIVDILSEKMGKNVDFLTKEALSTFADATKLRDNIKSQVGGIDNIKKQIDDVRLTAKNKADFILAQADTTKPDEVSGAKQVANKIQLDAEKTASKLEKTLNKKKDLVNKLKDKFKNSILANYVHVDDNLDFIFPPGGAATIPFSLFGKDLSFGASLEMNNIPSKPPVKLIFPSGLGGIFKNVQFLTSKSKPKPTTPVVQPTIADIIKQETKDIKSPVKSTINTNDKNLSYKNTLINENLSDNVQVKFSDGTTKTIPSSSLQEFVDTNKDKYDFIYVTEYVDGVLREVDALIQSGTPENLAIAKEKLEAAKTKSLVNTPKGLTNASNSAIDDKIKELNNKNSDLVKNTQPLLKTLLGFITFPIKIIADIIKWLMDFFMSLTNPMTLASKMKEFLSFQWILQFFKPDDVLAIFGLKFQPLVLIPYATSAATATGKFGGSVAGMADMSKYINLGFIPTLPTYSADQYKNLLKGVQPFRLLTIFQMMEKFINGVIDFIWSLFGIEALIPAPHLNMSSMYSSNQSLKPEDIKKVVDGALPQGNKTPKVSDGLNSNTNNSSQLNPVIQKFVYEVKLPDGTTKSFLNRDELDIYVQSNSDVNFDFTF